MPFVSYEEPHKKKVSSFTPYSSQPEEVTNRHIAKKSSFAPYIKSIQTRTEPIIRAMGEKEKQIPYEQPPRLLGKEGLELATSPVTMLTGVDISKYLSTIDNIQNKKAAPEDLIEMIAKDATALATVTRVFPQVARIAKYIIEAKGLRTLSPAIRKSIQSFVSTNLPNLKKLFSQKAPQVEKVGPSQLVESKPSIATQEKPKILSPQQQEAQFVLQKQPELFHRAGLSSDSLKELKPEDLGSIRKIVVDKNITDQDKIIPIQNVVLERMSQNHMTSIDASSSKPTQFLKAVNFGFIRSTSSRLRVMGPAGKELDSMLITSRRNAEVLAGTNSFKLDKLLNKLSKSEQGEFHLYAEGKKANPNPKLKEALDEWNFQRENIANIIEQLPAGSELTIKGLDGETRAWTPRQDYFPREYDLDELSKAEIRDGIISHLINSGQAKTVFDAQTLLKKFLRIGKERRYGHLQIQRIADIPGYKTDPRTVLLNYISNAYKRIEQTKIFGAQDQFINMKLREIESQNGPQAFNQAKDVVQRYIGLEQRPQWLSDITSPIMAFETVAHLGLSAISNLGSTVQTGVKTGWVNTIKSTGKIIAGLDKETATQSGALLSHTMKEVIDSAGGVNKYAEKFLNVVGMTPTENFNRILASIAGRQWIKKTVQDFLKHPANPRLLRALKSVYLNPKEIILAKGITVEQELQAANMVSNITQGRAGVMDLPYFYTSTEGKIVTQFKKFIFTAAKFLKDEVVNEATHGNLIPLIRYTTAAPVIGEAIGDVKAFIRGRKRPTIRHQLAERILDNYIQAGTIGIISDMFQAAEYGQASGVTAALAGATVGDIGRTIYAGTQAVKGEFKPAIRSSIGFAPVIGTLAGPVGTLSGVALQTYFNSLIQSKKNKRHHYLSMP